MTLSAVVNSASKHHRVTHDAAVVSAGRRRLPSESLVCRPANLGAVSKCEKRCLILYKNKWRPERVCIGNGEGYPLPSSLEALGPLEARRISCHHRGRKLTPAHFELKKHIGHVAIFISL